MRKACVFGFVLMSSTFAYANRMEDLAYQKHCGELGPADCAEALNDARGHCISEEEYQTGKDKNRVPLCVQRGKKFVSWCACSCFASKTRLYVKDRKNDDLAGDGWLRIDELSKSLPSFQFATLSENANFSNFNLEWNDLEMWSSGPEKNPLIVIQAENGWELSVTGGHAILLGSGEMVLANTLEVGQSLVTIDGEEVKIASLGRSTEPHDVYNVLTKTKSKLSHVVFAEGFAVGDLAWENSLYGEIGSVLVRQ